MANRQVDRALQTLRIIVAAMMLGIVSFGAITVFLIIGGATTTDAGLGSVMLPILGGLALVGAPAYFLIRRTMLQRLRRQWEGQSAKGVPTAELAQSFTTLTIIGAALAEGTSIFGIVVFLLSADWLALLAPALGLLLLAALFPTRGKFERFVSDATGQHWR